MSLIDDPDIRAAVEDGRMVIEVCDLCGGEFAHGSRRQMHHEPGQCIAVLVGRIKALEENEDRLIQRILKLEGETG